MRRRRLRNGELYGGSELIDEAEARSVGDESGECGNRRIGTE